MLLNLPFEQALAEVERLDNECKQLKEELFKICWYMRGSVSLDSAFTLSQEDRMIISGIIKENLETTRETKLPFF